MDFSSVTLGALVCGLVLAFAKWFKRTDFEVSFRFRTRLRR